MSDDNLEKYDAFTDAIIAKIGPDVFASLTDQQRDAITDAISACRPLSRHPLDIRGTISLFYARYYYVFLMGRDRRHSTSATEADRRQGTELTGGLIFLLFALSPILLLCLLMLYFIKSMLGINLVHGRHAWEVIVDWIK